jgi:hypothetical protein
MTEQKYQSIVHQIADAESPYDAVDVMQQLTPEAVEDRIRRLAKARGEATDSIWTYDGPEFFAEYRERELYREPGTTLAVNFESSGRKVIYRSSGDSITTFDAIVCWRMGNFIEEIIETGQISI